MSQFPTDYQPGHDAYQDFHPYMDLHKWKKLPNGDITVTGNAELNPGTDRVSDSPCSPFPNAMILPITEIEMYNFSVPAPRYPRAYSRYMYGKDWRKPDPDHNMHGEGTLPFTVGF